MGSRYLTDMADILRGAGLTVVEEPGWQTRARGSGGYDGNRPWVIMWHHTASDTSPANDVSYIINADDGPLANLYLARSGTVHVIAAGATNTNGKGGPLGGFSRGTVPLDSMNTYGLGIEAANNGVGQQWPQVQIDSYFKINNALTAAYGLAFTDLSSHEGWAPGRKIDPAQAGAVQGPWRPASINSSQTWRNDDIRNEAARRSMPGPPPDPDPEDDMKWSRLRITEAGAVFMGMSDGRVFPQAEWVNGDDPEQLARYQNYERFGFGHDLELSFTDLKGVCLLGSVPGRDDKFAQAGLTWSKDMFGKVVGEDR